MPLKLLQNRSPVTGGSSAESIKIASEPRGNARFCKYLMEIENENEKSGYPLFFPEIIPDSCLYAIAFRQISPLSAHIYLRNH